MSFAWSRPSSRSTSAARYSSAYRRSSNTCLRCGYVGFSHNMLRDLIRASAAARAQLAWGGQLASDVLRRRNGAPQSAADAGSGARQVTICRLGAPS